MWLYIVLIALVVAMIRTGRVGDERDMAAGMLVCVQFGLEHLFSGRHLVCAVIFVSALWCFVLYSVKTTGVVLGLLSAPMAVFAILAWTGWLPSEVGAGVAFNYNAWVTQIMLVQIGVLAVMAGRGNVVA
jgi:hypothetical protein